MSKRIILCRPRGGLNDLLCQIQHCFAYSRRFNRTLVLDTSRSGLHDDILRYFSFDNTKDEVLSWAAYKAKTQIDGKSVHPAVLQDRLDAYETSFQNGVYVDVESSTPLDLDFKKSFDEDIVVHENCGGGINSYWMLKYLRPTEFLKSAIEARLQKLPAKYRAVHIRNTDLKTDHKKLLDELGFALSGRDVLFCTDSGELQSELRQGVGHSARAHFLADLDPKSNAPLHAAPTTSVESNVDMLADLVALGRAERLYFAFTSEGRISGFSGLAYAMHCSRFKNHFEIEPKASTSTISLSPRRSGLLKFLKAQFVIGLAKGLNRIILSAHEVWPNR